MHRLINNNSNNVSSVTFLDAIKAVVKEAVQLYIITIYTDPREMIFRAEICCS